MKKIISFAVVVSVLLAGCQNEAAKSEDHDHEAMQKEEAAMAQKPDAGSSEVQIANEVTNMLWPAYEQLQAALVVKDVASARNASLLLAEGAKGQANLGEIERAANGIIHTADVEEQRTLFSVISNTLIDQVKKSGMNTGSLYVAYCPMAFDDKGAYWLTGEKKIINPYFGDVMLKCGSIEETIGAVQ